jgi:uncharacterized protein
MPHDYVILCLAAALGGAVNAIAGGGTLLTFPALFAALGSTGDAAVIANGTSTVALVPGSIAALVGYRQEIRAEGRWVLALVAPSLAGGMIGSLLVVLLPSEIFKVAVPWLILIAASLFALQPQIARLTGIGQPHDASAMPGIRLGSIAFQFLVAVYGGYFGAGIGILMLSALAMLGMSDIHRMNAAKTLLASLINGTSCIVFIASGDVNWPFAIAMSIASSVGGYLAAHAARHVDRRVVRAIVVGIGFVLAAYYFYRQAAG